MSGILMMSVGNSYGSAPVNTVAPVVSGTATFGQTLSCTTGTWTGSPTPTFTYQWQRSGSNIGSATSSTYTLVAADVGNTIRCVVTATNSVAPSGVSANSNSTSTVVATVPGAPTIGTATATGSTTATVAYTAPASNGGATITTYTATSSPGSVTGTLSTSGSGTITVSGLSSSTSYTFTVTATNSVGTSAASAASNSITTSAAAFNLSNTTSTGITTYRTLGVDPVYNQLYVSDSQSTSSDMTRYDIASNGALSNGTTISTNTSSVPKRQVSFRPPSSTNAIVSGYSTQYYANYSSRANMFSSCTTVDLGSDFAAFNSWGNAYTGNNVVVFSGASNDLFPPYPAENGLVILNLTTFEAKAVNLANTSDVGQQQTTGIAFDPSTNRLYVGFYPTTSIINVYSVTNPNDFNTISFTYIERVTTSLGSAITAIGCNSNYIWFGGENVTVLRSPRS